MKLQQAQQNLQSIMGQKQQLEIEKVETDKALEELKKGGRRRHGIQACRLYPYQVIQERANL